MKIKSLLEISDQYNLILVDIWGVVYDGVNALTPAIDVINHLYQQGKNIMFVSNNPRPNNFVKMILTKIGVDQNIPLVTSGDVTRQLIETKHSGQTVYHIGAYTNTDILQGLPVTEVNAIHQADFVLLSPFIEQEDDYTKFDGILEVVAELELPVYCPNPDSFAPHHGTLRKTAGFFAGRLEEFGGSVIRIGKPYSNIYDYAMIKFGQDIDKSKILMIGDGMATDIKGGLDYGVDTLFVEAGISRLMIENYEFSSKYSIDHLK